MQGLGCPCGRGRQGEEGKGEEKVFHGWDILIDKYCQGYRAALQKGNEIGFTVIFGAEMRFEDNDNDYLIYGIDENWLRQHPYVICQSARDFFQKYHNL